MECERLKQQKRVKQVANPSCGVERLAVPHDPGEKEKQGHNPVISWIKSGINPGRVTGASQGTHTHTHTLFTHTEKPPSISNTGRTC